MHVDSYKRERVQALWSTKKVKGRREVGVEEGENKFRGRSGGRQWRRRKHSGGEEMKREKNLFSGN